jgi:mRNA interferase MazF
VNFSKGRGSEQAGHRPAVIVSNNVINTTSSTVIVAALTKAEQKQSYPQNVHLPAGSLLSDAQTILCSQLLTLSKERLQRHYATLHASQIPELDRALSVGLGLAGSILREEAQEEGEEP